MANEGRGALNPNDVFLGGDLGRVDVVGTAMKKRLATLLDTARQRRAADPLKYWRPTPAQRAWLSDASPAKLFRSGNQLGKTTAQIVECVSRCLGRHPFYSTPDPPVEVWLVTHSWEQSIQLQSKIWDMVPRSELADDTEYRPGRGFRGKTPLVVFKNGSVLRIRTCSQGSLGLSGSTISFVGIDEPPTQAVWNELSMRVLRLRGAIGLTMTPIGRPVEWIKELVDSGAIADHHYPLTAENTKPMGALAPLVSQDQIEAMRAQLLPYEIPQRLDGAWEGAPMGRIFVEYNPDEMFGDYLPAGDALIGIGIDHGGGAGCQAAVLIAAQRDGDGLGTIWVLDETLSDGATDPRQDATAIVDMLKRNAMSVDDVDLWRGDRPYGGRRGVGTKSNTLLERAIRHVTRSPCPRLKILHPKKFTGSVEYGCRILHGCMIRDGFYVRPAASYVNKSLVLWEGGDDSNKHILDGLRYITIDILGRRHASQRKIRMY